MKTEKLKLLIFTLLGFTFNLYAQKIFIGYQNSVVSRLDNDTPGVTTLQETMEAYQGGKIAQRDNLSTVQPAVFGVFNPVYDEAHNSVVPHSPIGGVIYTKNPPSPSQVIYNSSTEGFIYTPKGTSVQTFPNKMN